MIIGNGLIASNLKRIDSHQYLFFSSGVSNSMEFDQNKFSREREILDDVILKYSDRTIIYFSSVSVNFSDSEYIRHKKNIEKVIVESGLSYYIFRLPQLVGSGGNPNNLVNFLKNKIQKNEPFKLNTLAVRSILDVYDLVSIVEKVLITHEPNVIFDIAGIEFKSVKQIVEIIQGFSNKKIIYDEVEIEDSILKINSPFIDGVIEKIGIKSHDYTKKVISKYF